MAQPGWIGHTLLGRYKIEQQLGSGGMAAVFKATDANLGRVVAIKVIHPLQTQSADFVRRFESEAKLVAQLNHPNIVHVYDFNREGDNYFIVFEYVPGETLQQWLKRLAANRRQMPTEKAILIASSIADALGYAHKRNLVHRDVKPANIMASVQGKAVLTDFGIAKIVDSTRHTATGAVLGTARYMSPEQIMGERVDARTDIYSLGVVLYEMLGGRPPYDAESAMTILMMHINDPVPDIRQLRPDIPPDLVAAIRKAMAKDPAGRFAAADQMAAALRAVGQSPRPPAAVAAVDKKEQIHPETEVVVPVFAATDYPDTEIMGPAAGSETADKTIPDHPETEVAAPSFAASDYPDTKIMDSATVVSHPVKEETAAGRAGSPTKSGGLSPIIIGVVIGGVAALLLAGLIGGGIYLFTRPAKEEPALIDEKTETPSETLAEEPAQEPTQEPSIEEEAAPSEEEEAPPGEEETTEESSAESEPDFGGSGAMFLDRAFAGEFSGSTVDVLSVLVDAEESLFLDSIASFEEETGIDVAHTGTQEFETQIAVQIEGGNAPDVVMWPQPALLASYVAAGDVPEIRDYIDEAGLQERYAQGWLDSATFPGPDGEPLMAGVWYKAANKDLVWYNKAAFDAAGYEVPTTWDEMLELSDTIVADGNTPWCIGMESGFATGWVATDWIEALMLRTVPPKDYDAWVAGELPFSSDQVKNAAQLMSDIWLNPDYVLGGTDQIVTESIFDSAAHMFEDPPTCWMHKQAAWVTGFFPEGLEPGVHYDVFYLPPVDPRYGEPVLMAGEIVTMISGNDRPEVVAFLEYLSTGASVETFVRSGSGLSPHQDSSLDWYSNDVDRRVAEILLNAETVRFDASDLMPPAVGSGTFWSIMTDFTRGSLTLDQALQEIDDSWPGE